MDINYDTVKARQSLAYTIQFANVTDHTDPGKILEEISTARSQGFDNGRQLSEFVLVRNVSCI
jgi:hypothetical protein